MIIKLKNKDKLLYDEFVFKCSIGKNGLKKNKIEGDKSTPKGLFSLGKVYYRPDRIDKPNTKLKIKKITRKMGWCDDSKNKKYNKEILLSKKNKGEKLFRSDRIYDLILVINYNTKKTIKNKGSAIFIHLTENYKPTLGCIAIQKNDLLVLLKLIDTKTKIRIS